MKLVKMKLKPTTIEKRIFCKVIICFVLCSSLLFVTNINMECAKAAAVDTNNIQSLVEFDYSECDDEFVDNEIIIRFKNECLESDVKEFFSDERIKSVEDFYKSVYDEVKNDEDSVDKNVKQIKDEIGRTYVVTFRNKRDCDLIDLVEKLNKNELVDYAEPNYICSVEETPNEYTNSSWYDHYNMDRIQADKAWDIASGNTVYVGIMDTGIDANHPDLKDNIATELGRNFVGDANETVDEHSHGTHVAGIVGAKGNNSIGVAGVNWNAKLVPLKICGEDGSSNMRIMARAILYAKSKNIPIVNLSYGKSYDDTFFNAVEQYGESGGLLVTAAENAGQNNDNDITYNRLATMDNVIVVAATSKATDNQLRNGRSNYGFYTVDIAAPGENIWSTVPTSYNYSGYEMKSGTSMATPHVAGTASLIKAAHPSYTPAMIKACIVNGVTYEPTLGSCINSGGILNTYRALIGSSEAEEGTMLIVEPGKQETMNQAITRTLGDRLESASEITKIKIIGSHNFGDGNSSSDSANYRLKNLKYVDLSHYQGALGDYAFANCINLIDVTIGNKGFGKRCFQECTKLEGIHSIGVLQTNESMDVVDLSGVAESTLTGDYCFTQCENIKKVCLPDSKNVLLGVATFWKCHNLKTIYINNSECKNGEANLTNLSIINSSLG